MAFTRRGPVLAGFSLVILTVELAIVLSPSAQAQRPDNTARSTGQARDIDWSGPNFDLALTHYSPADNITASNVSQLTLKWSMDTQPGQQARSQVTPLVVGGVMYFNAGNKLFAVNGVTGELVWTYEALPGDGPLHRRGPSYGDGRIYTYGRTMMYAVDAKTGKPVESFGNKGRLPVAEAAVAYRSQRSGQRFPGLCSLETTEFLQGHAVSDRGQFRTPYSRRTGDCVGCDDRVNQVGVQ